MHRPDSDLVDASAPAEAADAALPAPRQGERKLFDLGADDGWEPPPNAPVATLPPWMQPAASSAQGVALPAARAVPEQRPGPDPRPVDQRAVSVPAQAVAQAAVPAPAEVAQVEVAQVEVEVAQVEVEVAQVEVEVAQVEVEVAQVEVEVAQVEVEVAQVEVAPVRSAPAFAVRPVEAQLLADPAGDVAAEPVRLVVKLPSAGPVWASEETLQRPPGSPGASHRAPTHRVPTHRASTHRASTHRAPAHQAPSDWAEPEAPGFLPSAASAVVDDLVDHPGAPMSLPAAIAAVAPPVRVLPVRVLPERAAPEPVVAVPVVAVPVAPVPVVPVPAAPAAGKSRPAAAQPAPAPRPPAPRPTAPAAEPEGLIVPPPPPPPSRKPEPLTGPPRQAVAAGPKVRRRRVPVVAAAVVLALGSAAGAYGLLGGSSEQGVAEGSSAAQARNWVLSNAGDTATILAPSASVVDLTGHGYDAARLVGYGNGSGKSDPVLSKGCCTFLVVSGPSSAKARAGLPAAVAGLYDRSRPTARFTVDGERTEIRQVLDSSPAKVAAAVSSDQKILAAAGRQIAAAARLEFSSDARQLLADGVVDPRVGLALIELTSRHVVSVAGFPAVPGEDAAGAPRRTVAIDRVDSDRIVPGGDLAKEVRAFFAGKDSRYVPDVVRTTRIGDDPILTLTFQAPTPLGLLATAK